jgi:hypothetical protein
VIERNREPPNAFLVANVCKQAYKDLVDAPTEDSCGDCHVSWVMGHKPDVQSPRGAISGVEGGCSAMLHVHANAKAFTHNHCEDLPDPAA